MEFAEVIEMVNQLEIERTDGKQMENEDDANREIVGVMRTFADYRMDIDKFVRRAERVQKKLKEAGDDPKKLEAVKQYFENYMGKVFADTGLEKLEDFDADTLTKDVLAKKAQEVIHKKRGITRARESQRDQIIHEVLDERRARTDIIDTENFSSGFAAEREAGQGDIAQVPEMTEGQLVLQKMRDEAAEIRKSGDPQEAEIAELGVQIEDARRDRGTGLLERGEYYKQLEQHFEDDPEGEKEKSVLFIDMGFLKYFDKKGGGDVGDAALKMGAELMKNALNGVPDAEGNVIEGTATKGEVFRYGGDEFTVIIDGGPEEVQKFKQTLELLKQEAGKIPTGKQGTNEGYHPTELVFNYGSADTKLVDELMESFVESGAYSEKDLSDPERLKNIKAELMTLVADKGIEQEKAVGRFMMLVEGLRGEDYKKSSMRKEQIDNMIIFSNKALFAEKGGADLLEKWAESGDDKETIRAEIEDWVRRQIKERAIEEKKHTELKDQLAEVHVRVWSADRKIHTLEKALEEKTGENEGLIAELALMRKEKEIAEKDKAEIIRLRGEVAGQQEDQQEAA
ncbi:GGDEF domain-containing protein [Patescibacteria group bacterium]